MNNEQKTDLQVNVTVVNLEHDHLDDKISDLQKQLDDLQKQKEIEKEIEKERAKNPVELHMEVLMNELESILQDNSLSFLNLMSVCINLMQIVEKYPKLKGVQRKELVVAVLRKYQEKHQGELGLLDMVPDMIDSCIKLEKGDLTISIEDVQKVAACCGTLCMSFSSPPKKNCK
jgi:hypothetical protein